MDLSDGVSYLLGAVFVVGMLFVFLTLDKPKDDELKFKKFWVGKGSESPREFGVNPGRLQKWIFVIWIVLVPLYLLLDWDLSGSHLTGDKLIRDFQYRQKLISDLWAASAVFFGVFWGLRR